MDLIATYGYKDFTDTNFPFDIKIRQNNNFPHIKHMHDSLQICYVNKGCISMSVGFKSICHFNKMFTRATGSSPSKYRKNLT